MTTANEKQVGGDHYRTKTIQPWAAMESWMSREAFSGYLQGNAIKYLCRHREKGGLADLEKAKHYIEKLIETAQAAPAAKPDDESVKINPGIYIDGESNQLRVVGVREAAALSGRLEVGAIEPDQMLKHFDRRLGSSVEPGRGWFMGVDGKCFHSNGARTQSTAHRLQSAFEAKP